MKIQNCDSDRFSVMSAVIVLITLKIIESDYKRSRLQLKFMGIPHADCRHRRVGIKEEIMSETLD